MVEINTLQQVGVSGAIWKIHEPNIRDIITIKQKFGLSEIVSRILVNRQITVDQVFDFLHPTLKMTLPDPFHLLDMQKAVIRIEQAIYNNENIVIFGDYDVDGATSSALLKRYFTKLGINASIYIPDRIKEGYGPNIQALSKMKDQGYNLCITVDCGTVAHEPIAAAQSMGLDIIVIDHHLGSPKLPNAIAIVNPNRLDETSKHTNLAAVGVSFLLLVALNKTLREKGFFQNIPEPNLINFLDLVALGTVCDVMKLVGLNRAFVSLGLKVMCARKNTGLKVLSDIIGLEEKPSTYQLGYNIGPHINAGGRVGCSDLGARLLSTDIEQEAIKISAELQNFNIERKEIENRSLEEAMTQAQKLVLSGKNIIMVVGNWHSGIIGIVAGRIKDKFYLPTIVISLNDGIGKASGRSITDVDLGSAVLSAKLENLIIEGGGHAMAAGFSVYENKITELYNFFSQHFQNINKQKTLIADGVITVKSVNLTLWQELQSLEPFGTGNSEPRFIIKNVKIRNPQIVGVNHIKCLICEEKIYIQGISFRCTDTELGAALMQCRATSLLGKISVNYWRGNETIQFIIEDAI